ncbi:MAG: hypothetical protein J4G00_03980 [Actinomycetia bacterium]|nr:hypothetical protein [Actinomycetes bacterium]
MDTSDRNALGRSLAFGSLLLLGAGLIIPGRLLIDLPSGLDMSGLNQVLIDNATLTNVSTVLAIFAFGLILYSLVRI